MSDSKALTEEEQYQLNGEGFVFLLAGTETTAVGCLLWTSMTDP
jgi:hypothetical protein